MYLVGKDDEMDEELTANRKTASSAWHPAYTASTAAAPVNQRPSKVFTCELRFAFGQRWWKIEINFNIEVFVNTFLTVRVANSFLLRACVFFLQMLLFGHPAKNLKLKTLTWTHLVCQPGCRNTNKPLQIENQDFFKVSASYEKTCANGVCPKSEFENRLKNISLGFKM